MAHPDPALLRAGFVSAFGQPAVRERVGEHFATIINDPTFQELADDDARTDYLRKRLTEELRSDSVVRKSVRRTLKKYVGDLGVRVKG